MSIAENIPAMFGTAVGTGVLVAETAALVDASYCVGRRLYPQRRLEAIAATSAIVPGTIVVILEVLGVAGLLEPVPALVAVLALWFASRAVLRRTSSLRTGAAVPRLDAAVPRSGAAVLRSGRQTRSEWIAVLSAAGLVAFLALALAEGVLAPRGHFDALDYHLPMAVQWLQAGNLRFVPIANPGSHQMQFPGNFELMELWILLPLHQDFLVQLASLTGVAMLATGIVLLARSRGASLRAGAIAALVVLTLPNLLVSQIAADLADLFMAGALTACAAFVARYANSREMRDLMVAAIAAGLAIGSRYQALIDILPVLAIVLVIEVVRRPGLKSSLKRLLLAGVAVLTAGGYFYVRNAVDIGNPFYPQPWSLALHSFPGARNMACCSGPSWIELGWRPSLWGHKALQILFGHMHSATVVHGWGPVLASLLAGGVLLPVISAARRRERSGLGWAWALYPLAQLVCYLATPLSASQNARLAVINSRFMLVPAAASAALLAGESARWSPSWRRTVAPATLLCALASTAAFSGGESRQPVLKAAMLFVLIAAGLIAARWSRAGTEPARETVGRLVGRVVAGRQAPEGIRGPTARRWPVRILGVAGLSIGAAVIAIPLQRHYERARAALPFAAVETHLRPSDRVVTVVGICEIYELYGPNLQRRVLYLTGDPGLETPQATTYSAWLREINRHKVAAVVVRNPPEPDCFGHNTLPQARWIAAHPDHFPLIYRPVSNRYGAASVYAVRP